MKDDDVYRGDWHRNRKRRLEMDDNQCVVDGEWCSGGKSVHHIRKAREVEDPQERHAVENLVTLCRFCHSWLERLSPERQKEILESDNPADHAPPRLDLLNPIDRWILDFLHEREWASPNLMRTMYSEEIDGSKSRQWFNGRLRRLEEHGFVDRVHEDASERRLVSDPREGE